MMKRWGSLMLLAVMAVPAHAQSTSTAPGFWNSPYSRSVSQQALDLAAAEAMLRARNNGYGAGVSNTNIGTYNSTTNYNGTTTNNTSGSTNVVNSNSTSSTVSGSGINLTVTTGQTAGPTTQGASSGVSTGSSNVLDLGVHQ